MHHIFSTAGAPQRVFLYMWVIHLPPTHTSSRRRLVCIVFVESSDQFILIARPALLFPALVSTFYALSETVSSKRSFLLHFASAPVHANV